MTHHVQALPTTVSHVVTPTSVAEALDWLAEPNTRPVSGGTDLLIELDRGEHRELATLVDLTRLPGLDTVESAGGTVTIGGLVTHNRCVADPILRRHAIPLVQASAEVGSPQLRNRATIAGNIVTASPANDTLSALVALDAEVTLASRSGERRLALSDFHLGVRRTALEPGELLTAISFPALGPDWRGVFLKLGLRRAQAISVVHVAVVTRLDGERVEELRIALGSVAPTIVRAPEAEALLVGHPLDAQRIAAAADAAAGSVSPIDDIRATAPYRSRLVSEMVRRALAAVRDDAAVLPEDPALLWGRSGGRWPTGAGLGGEHHADSPITATVNGRELTGPGQGMNLLDWLRSRGLTGTKEGCAEGECGSCTVDLDGLAVLSCLVPATRAAGAAIITIEGLGAAAGVDDPLHPLQQAFIDTGAVQCGFCIPGFLMSGSKLLEEHPAPTDEQVKIGLSGNLCRCTGYYKIEEAVRVALDGPTTGEGSGS